METDNQPSPPFFSLKHDRLEVDEETFYKFLIKPELHKLLYERYVVRRMEALKPEEQEELKLQLGHEALFGIQTTCFPGYLRYVRKQVRNLKWYQTQIKELAYLITLDLLYGKKASLKKAKETPKLNKRKSSLEYERVTERTRRRFFEYYPELLSKPLRDVMHDLEDRRERSFNSIFTAPSIGQIESDSLASMPIPFDEYDVKFMQLRLRMMPLHSEYRMVEPYDTEELIKFHNYIKRIIPTIIGNYGPPAKENQWIKNHLQYGTTLVEKLYQTIMLSVISRWFRKKQPSAREKLLHEEHPLRYSREDAKNAVKYTSEWIQDSTRASNIILRGVIGLNKLGMPKAGIWLYQECLKQIELEPEDLGLCYHNLAIQYRDINQPRKFKTTLMKAMKVWEETESQYDVAVTWAFLAHAYYLEGNMPIVKQAKEKSMSILGQLNENNYQLSWGYIHLADCARWTHDVKWEIQALTKGFEYASDHENYSFFDYYNGRLIAINQGEDPFQLERMGLLKRPPLTPWMRIGSSFHPVFGSKDTETA